MDFIPNLHFNGECEQAIALYERAFHGQKTVFLRYRDADPQDLPGGSPKPDYVYHAEMIIGHQRFVMNDSVEELPRGVNVSLLVAFESKAAALEAYQALQEGASIRRPPQETTYSSFFVSLVDRFGVRWELIHEVEPARPAAEGEPVH